MDRKRFETLVEEAINSLPRSFRERIENVAVMVEERPPRRRSSRASSRTLLGLYHGVPLKDRGSYYGNIPPDVIVIYQEPIERLSASEEEIRERVREVVLHEVGHYFGLSEKELREIED
ncbi:MAG: metallopeptidase family protein [Candidatus Aminicenantes bacterium]|nr:metallopeptidase family protein [Candidatus Aminicenantes bacterium]